MIVMFLNFAVFYSSKLFSSFTICDFAFCDGKSDHKLFKDFNKHDLK